MGLQRDAADGAGGAAVVPVGGDGGATRPCVACAKLGKGPPVKAIPETLSALSGSRLTCIMESDSPPSSPPLAVLRCLCLRTRSPAACSSSFCFLL
eukprot:13083-Eustigmatos_ZCMA.PRE.1